MCHGTFEAEWAEAEAVAELERDFGAVPLEECDQVCDACYQQVSPANNPEYHADYIKQVGEKRIHLNTPLPTQTILDDTVTIRAYVDAELARKLNEWIDQEIADKLMGQG